ncbi:hypothetical protein HPP92_004830 [Vanilla planifolia]|uniref:Peptide N-acetyl-beta-D-glucosaminyl asparaginase amidase A N-terminal domain-containing protein n=2 Tax=Vanilla planifolia TaxID=51239 RepID=A0A835RKK0_VANPL|nr:hypothetical protein HPP92_004830 [Vanilla planifolia]
MGNPHLKVFSFFLFCFANRPSNSYIHRSKLAFSDELSTSLLPKSSDSASPTAYFEVRRPIPVPKTTPCSTLPPRSSRIVLEWTAACAGRQFDRIFGIWLAGVELLRSCTAEPRATGIVWTIQKDVTRYASLFSKPQTLAVYLGNLVDKTYTGIYHANVSFHFYFDKHRPPKPHPVPAFTSPADLIIPISKSLPFNDGLWFQIQNSTVVQGKQLAIPRNAYRAVLEVCVSFHSSDEFWYSNPPNSYISENNLTGTPGNGAFREVTVILDKDVVGAIWPFTVIYTGGINPLLWRPISGIGSFDLPSYDVEITPFLGKILNGKDHYFGFGVTDALNVWFIDANLHLWLDTKSHSTCGSLLKYKAPGYAPHATSFFKGLDGHFNVTASREIAFTGWVKSSYGKITSHFFQKLDYSNKMEFAGNGSIQAVNQSIHYNHGSYAKYPASALYSEEVFQNFPLYLYTAMTDQVNDSYSLVTNVSLGFHENKFAGESFGFSVSVLRNSQLGQGILNVKGNLVTSGEASTQQVYRYESTEGCYFRNVASKNYTILYDESGEVCAKIGFE